MKDEEAKVFDNGVARLYQADARDLPLPDKSVHCAVTSPPYFGLRDYSLGDGGIGLEPTLAEHIENIVAVGREENIVAVGREVRRVLRDDGTFWLNYGDAYARNGGDKREGPGALEHLRGIQKGMCKIPDDSSFKPKDLMMLPHRIAIALQDDGWFVRSAIVWAKPNPMPESVRDRPTNAYEMVFLLTKQPRYWYDAEAIRTAVAREYTPETNNPGHLAGTAKYRQLGHENGFRRGSDELGGANARNVWTIPTQGRPDAHFATFPDELPRRCILAGTSEKGVCAECGSQWERVVSASKGGSDADFRDSAYINQHGAQDNSHKLPNGQRSGDYQRGTTIGWQPKCDCDADVVPATVLDPFVGSGTTLAVAQSLGRQGVGTDLNPEYLEIAKKRIGGVPLPLFA